MSQETIILTGLPKISLNAWYSGDHWSKRKKIKDEYHWIVKSQFKRILPKINKYRVSYTFEFKTKPLDASNCIAMVKMIEDIIFEDDKWDIIEIGKIKSTKSKTDKVVITIETI